MAVLGRLSKWNVMTNLFKITFVDMSTSSTEILHRAKINNSSQIGLGYQQKIRDGVTITLSALIDGKNFNQGGHKVGLALELEN